MKALNIETTTFKSGTVLVPINSDIESRLKKLESERNELLVMLRNSLGFYGDSTGYYHVHPDQRKSAIELIKRISA